MLLQILSKQLLWSTAGPSDEILSSCDYADGLFGGFPLLLSRSRPAETSVWRKWETPRFGTLHPLVTLRKRIGKTSGNSVRLVCDFRKINEYAILLLRAPVGVRRAPLISPRSGGDGPESKSGTTERRSAHDRSPQGYGGGLVGSIAGRWRSAGRAFGIIELPYC
ncbi:hypothetical protein NPIL_64101 [Nephila pilipes]|uniref:Uncharacterized protein n=1 Tax=Nephila pilipes TaxID=299642 RepID=A0A8X6IR77_NEPPI|nr:hypothetical protein NPIL_64101 [Nephila pilipes]